MMRLKLLIVRSSPVLNLKFILCIYGFLHILQYFNCIIYIYAGSCRPYVGQMVQTVRSSRRDMSFDYFFLSFGVSKIFEPSKLVLTGNFSLEAQKHFPFIDPSFCPTLSKDKISFCSKEFRPKVWELMNKYLHQH